MAKDNYEAGLLGESAGHDAFSIDYQLGEKERERRAKSGDSGGLGITAGGGGGLIALALLTYIALFSFIVSFCVYPIAGFAVLLNFLFFVSVMHIDGGGLIPVMLFMVPCALAYGFTIPLELKFGKVQAYQTFRHYWRLVVGTYTFHLLGMAFHLESEYPHGAPFSGYLIDWCLTIGGFFFVYLNSLRLDAKYDLVPINNPWIDRAITPVLKWLTGVVARDVRETGALTVKTDAAPSMEISVHSDHTVRLGAEVIPVWHIISIKEHREYRVTFFVVGLLLFFVVPGVLQATVGEFDSFMPQAIGLAGLLCSAYLVITALLPATPPGKLQAPLRSQVITYDDAENKPRFLQVWFKSPADERLFIQAWKNGVKDVNAMKKASVSENSAPFVAAEVVKLAANA